MKIKINLAYLIGNYYNIGMGKIEMNAELARAAARDEADRSAKAAGRKHWSEMDFSVYVKTYNKLWPLQAEKRH